MAGRGGGARRAPDRLRGAAAGRGSGGFAVTDGRVRGGLRGDARVPRSRPAAAGPVRRLPARRVDRRLRRVVPVAGAGDAVAARAATGDPGTGAGRARLRVAPCRAVGGDVRRLPWSVGRPSGEGAGLARPGDARVLGRPPAHPVPRREASVAAGVRPRGTASPRAAGDRPGLVPGCRDDAHPALVDARHSGQRLHPHRPGDGPAGTHRDLALRAA